MIAFILWYVAVTLIGLAAFPLAFRLLPGLPGRGYAFSRILGLLLWGYVFWLPASLGILSNSLGSELLALGLVVAAGVWALFKLDWAELQAWWRKQRGLVITGELIFLAAFIFMTLVRAANPETTGTEKPMEMAFINAILRSPNLPPRDPWLAGYSISYYYFGYLMVAMLSRLSALPGSMGFNLGIALVFALTASGAYGLVYDLLAGRKRVKRETPGRLRTVLLSLLGPFFVLFAGNLEGFLEILHSRGLGGAGLWAWLSIQNIDAPAQIAAWPPRFWWWWRASRVLLDHSLLGISQEIIDEFPAFSYVLGDLHPHVLAMPFGLLAIALALNLFRGGAEGSFGLFGLRVKVNRLAFGLAALALGALAFLNLSDFPIYLAFFIGAFLVKAILQAVRAGEAGSAAAWTALKDTLILAIPLGLAAVLLYLPYYLAFTTQASGLVPNMIYVTSGTQFWVMWATLLLPILAYLAYRWRQSGSRLALKRGLLGALGLAGGLLLLSLLLALAILSLSAFSESLPRLGQVAETFRYLMARVDMDPNQPAAMQFLNATSLQQWVILLREGLARRLASPGAWLSLLAVGVLLLGLLLRRRTVVNRSAGRDLLEPGKADPVEPLDSQEFALLLGLLGFLLVFGLEFFFVRDQFGNRMNSIFKFYFATWLAWGLLAAYAAAVLLDELRGLRLAAGGVFVLLVVAASISYPVLGFLDRTSGFRPEGGLTLDSAAYLQQSAPNEAAAITWLDGAPDGNILEATGGQYSEFARIAEYTGLPTILGWGGHEGQWRNGDELFRARPTDIQKIYTARLWQQADDLLKKYNVRYLVIGPRERSAYGVNEGIFKRNLTPVFTQGDITIYQVP